MNINNLYLQIQDKCFRCGKESRKKPYFAAYCYCKLCSECIKNYFLNESLTINCGCEKKLTYYRRNFSEQTPFDEERHILYENFLRNRDDFQTQIEYNDYLLKCEVLLEELHFSNDETRDKIKKQLQLEKDIKVNDRNKNKRNEDKKKLSEMCKITDPSNFLNSENNYQQALFYCLNYSYQINSEMVLLNSGSNLINISNNLITNINTDIMRGVLLLPKFLGNTIIEKKGNLNLEKKAGGYDADLIYSFYENYSSQGL